MAVAFRTNSIAMKTLVVKIENISRKNLTLGPIFFQHIVFFPTQRRHILYVYTVHLGPISMPHVGPGPAPLFLHFCIQPLKKGERNGYIFSASLAKTYLIYMLCKLL